MPLIHEDPPRHRAFVLRCWEARGERPGRPAAWRFSLECVEKKEKRYLPDLEGLVAFLRDELANAGDEADAEPSPDGVLTEDSEPEAGATSAPVSPTG